MSSADFEKNGVSWDIFLVMHLLGQLLCLASNGTIVVVILRTSHLRTVSSMLVLALTFSDILLSVLWNVVGVRDAVENLGGTGASLNTSRPKTEEATVSTRDREVSENSSEDPQREGLLQSHPPLCSLVGFLWQTILASSTLYQALVACDRYFFIVYPLRYEAFATRKKALVVLLLLAFLALVLPSAALLSGGTYVYLLPAGTCVSHITWYVLFILLVYLPSVAVTLASNLGIWSLCVRQLNTPGRAKLVREAPPHTEAFNLLEENGCVAVRRDIVDDFICCIPALCRTSPAGEVDNTTCLNHLVQNSSLMFVEGFIAAVPVTAAPNELTMPGCYQNVTGPNFICPAPPTVLPPSPSPSEHTKRNPAGNPDIESPKDNDSDPTNNGKDPKEHIIDEEGPQKNETDLPKQPNEEPKSKINHPVKQNSFRSEGHNESEQALTDKNLRLSAKGSIVKTISDPPQAEQIPLTPRLAHRPISSPSVMSSRSARSHRFRKTPSSFLLSQDLTDTLSKASAGGDSQQEETRGLLSHGVCSILKASPAVSLEALEKVELSMQRVCARNLRVTGLSTSSYPSTSSLRSVISDTPGIFRCSSAVSTNATVSDSGGGAGNKADKAQVLSTIESPIVHWMIPPVRLGMQRSVSENVERKREGEEGLDQECDVIAERRAPLRRRAKTAVLVALPVVSLFLTLLPLVGVQTLLAAGVSIRGGVTAWVCHVMYFIIPSLNPFLIGLTNRHLRHAIGVNFFCRQNNNKD